MYNFQDRFHFQDHFPGAKIFENVCNPCPTTEADPKIKSWSPDKFPKQELY